MKKYLEPELTVVKFNLKDVLGASTPAKPNKPKDPNDNNSNQDWLGWS